jgi:hypothetical protein
MQSLGLEMHSAIIALSGHLNEAEALRLTRLLIGTIRMSYKWKDGDGMVRELDYRVWKYPVGLGVGAGGIGDTTIQPCFTLVQPLLESYTAVVPGVIGVDTWREHNSFYIIVNSCRYFSIRKLVRYLKKGGWEILDYTYNVCGSLPPKKSWWGRLWR